MKRLILAAIALLLLSSFVSSGVFAALKEPWKVNADTFVSAGDSTSNFNGSSQSRHITRSMFGSGESSRNDVLRWDFPAVLTGTDRQFRGNDAFCSFLFGQWCYTIDPLPGGR